MTLLELIEDVDTAKRAVTFVEVAEWLDANPHVMPYMEFYAERAAADGRKFGINALLERVRWELEMVEGRPYKANNSYAPALARILVARNPHIEGFISMRHSAFDEEVIPAHLLRK